MALVQGPDPMVKTNPAFCALIVTGRGTNLKHVSLCAVTRNCGVIDHEVTERGQATDEDKQIIGIVDVAIEGHIVQTLPRPVLLLQMLSQTRRLHCPD